MALEAVELMVIREGLALACQLNLVIDFVDSDASNAICKLNDSFILSPLDHVIEEIQSLFISVVGGSCCSVLRYANRVAHSLASSIFMSIEHRVWANCYLYFIYRLYLMIWLNKSSLL